MSNLFLVGKKDGGNRPVINLKNLNASIPYLHFKMEGLHLLKDILKEKDYVQDRPEGCLLLCSSSSKSLEVYPVLLGRSIIQIPLSMFWPGTSSMHVFKATENPNSNSKKNQYSHHRRPRRYALDEPNNRRAKQNREHIDFLLTEIGGHNKSE